MKSRLKTYIVTVALYHESFGGYDHSDGTKEVEVKAINSEVAGRKALKKVNHVGWEILKSIKEKTRG